MQIHVNSDGNISADSRVVSFVSLEADRAIGRYKDRLERLEFHLSDVNSHKSGTHDKRCVVEARAAGRRPLVVSMAARNLRVSIRGSLTKLKNSLEKHFGRSSPASRRRHAHAE